MTNLNAPLTMPLDNKSFLRFRFVRQYLYAMLVFSGVGFLDALYLSVERVLNRVPPCSFLHGCEKVTTSPYALLYGIPLSFLGVAFYLTMLIGLVLFLDTKKIIIIKLLGAATAFGFIFSLYLAYLQLFVIKAICIYCMLSALSSATLFIFGLLVLKSLRSYRKTENQ
jgi:uncharacterized membrane protein